THYLKAMSETWKSSSAFSVELLTDYVEGLVDPATAARIETHLADHEDAAAVVEGIRAYLAENEGDLEQMNAWLSRTLVTQESTHQEAETTPVRKLRPRYLAIAASAAVLAFVVAWWLVQSGSSRSAEEWQQFAQAQLQSPYPSPTVVRGGDTPTAFDSLRNTAANAFTNQQWNLAAQAYGSLLLQYPNEVNSADRFYLSLSELQSQVANESTEARLLSLATGESAYAAPARYYRVLYFLTQKDTNKAQSLAREALTASEVYQEKILREIADE
ncbi:MAG: zf-HC2 domain-containing protein, partial [Bacteroidota bacterium]